MAISQLGAVLRHIRDLAGPQVSEQSDAALLQAFLRRHDQGAFEALLLRHGPMVLRICQRTLGHHHDAEDAFQATFLVLARKAASIRKKESLASWLHGVAYRMATHAKRAAARRHKHESRANPAEARDPALSAAWQELQVLLDEEIEALPEALRAPFIHCCLETKSSAEAAHQLGLEEGTVRKRLSRARKLLQERLTRRGVSLSTMLAAAAVGANGVSAAIPPSLVRPTVKAAAQMTAGQSLAGTSVSAKVTTLVEGVIRTMFLNKCKMAILLLSWTATLGAGLGLAGLRDAGAEPPKGPPSPIEKARTRALGSGAPAAAEKGSTFEGGVVDAGTGKSVKGLAVLVRRLVAGKPAGELKLRGDAAGRFRFELPRDWADPPDARITVSVQAPSGFVALPYRNNYGDWQDVGVRVEELRREQALGVPPYFDRVLLFSTKQVKGRVLDPHGKPAEGVEVLACSAHLKDNKFVFPPRRVVRRTRTDAAGRFAVEVASPGTVVLYLLPEQYAPRLVKLTDPAGNLGDYKLQAGAKVSGKLLGVKNQILPGRWLRVGEPIGDPNAGDLDLWNVGLGSLARWCRTGPKGTFETAPLAPGEYEVTAHDPGQDPIAGRARVGKPLDAWLPPQKVTVAAEGAPKSVTLQAVPHVNVEIKVADRDGKPRDAHALSVRFTHDGKNYKLAHLIGESLVLREEFDNGRRVLRVPYGASSMEVFLLPRGLSDLCDYRPGKDAAEHRGWSVYLKDLDGDRTLEYVWAQGVQASLRLSTKNGSPLPEDVEVRLVQKSPYGTPACIPVGGGLYRLAFVRPDEPLRIEVTAIGYKPVTREVKLPAGKPQRLEVVLEKTPQKENGK